MTKTLLLLLACLSALTVSACETETGLRTGWRNPTLPANSKFARVLVVMVDETRARIPMEDALCARLKERGVHAVPSYEVIPDVEAAEREKVVAWIEHNAIEAVLTLEMVETSHLKDKADWEAMAHRDLREVLSHWRESAVQEEFVSLAIAWETGTWKAFWGRASNPLRGGLATGYISTTDFVLVALSDDGLVTK